MGHFLGEYYMCLSIPSKVTKIDEENNIATVDTMGVERKASLDLIDQPVVVGDYVLIHIGFAMNKIDEEDALASLDVYREIIEKMEEEELIKEDNSLSSLTSQKDCDVTVKQETQDVIEDDACKKRA